MTTSTSSKNTSISFRVRTSGRSTVARVTEGLADRQSAMREQAVEEIRSILERFQERA